MARTGRGAGCRRSNRALGAGAVARQLLPDSRRSRATLTDREPLEEITRIIDTLETVEELDRADLADAIAQIYNLARRNQ